MEAEEMKDSVQNWFNDRLKNPYYAAVSAVWLITNRVSVFTIFNFSDEQTAEERLSIVHQQIKNKKIIFETLEKNGCHFGLFQGFYGIILYSFIVGFFTMIFFNYLNVFGKWSYNYFGKWANEMRRNISPLKWVLVEEVEKEIENFKKTESELNSKKIEIKTIQKENDELIASYAKIKLENQNTFVEIEKFKTELSQYKPKPISDITLTLDNKYIWRNSYILPDGSEGTELFNISQNGFLLKNGSKLTIDNFTSYLDGKIISFDKIIDDKRHPNLLVRDKEFNFHGTEDETTIIHYTKIVSPQIEIISARYFHDKSYLNVKSKLQKLVDKGKTKFLLTSETMEGDPSFGNPKKIEILYKIDGGVTKGIEAKENTEIDFTNNNGI